MSAPALGAQSPTPTTPTFLLTISVSRKSGNLRAVPGFDGLDGVCKCLFQNAPSDRPQHQAEQSSFEILAITHNNNVNVCCAVGVTRKGIGVAGRAAPHIGVSRREDHAVRIGPVVVQTFPDAARSLGNISLGRAAVNRRSSQRACWRSCSVRTRKVTQPELGTH
jgi:hypothetical protein